MYTRLVDGRCSIHSLGCRLRSCVDAGRCCPRMTSRGHDTCNSPAFLAHAPHLPVCRAFKVITCCSLQAQSAGEKEAAVKAPPADIRQYLKPTGLMETRYIRMLASLCNETYYLSKLSVSIAWH